MFLKILIISLILIFSAMLLLGIKIFFTGRGRFPEYHIGSNPEMRKRGITCAKNTDTGYNVSKGSRCACCSNDNK